MKNVQKNPNNVTIDKRSYLDLEAKKLIYKTNSGQESVDSSQIRSIKAIGRISDDEIYTLDIDANERNPEITLYNKNRFICIVLTILEHFKVPITLEGNAFTEDKTGRTFTPDTFDEREDIASDITISDSELLSLRWKKVQDNPVTIEERKIITRCFRLIILFGLLLPCLLWLGLLVLFTNFNNPPDFFPELGQPLADPHHTTY